jgi:tape measure domain-containing protein
MEFDNAAFEKKVATTIASLGQLDKALKFDGAKQGFSDIGKAADGINLSGIGTHIEGISAKFLALSTVAITVLANITMKAVEAGIQIAKSLSLDQIISGFKEYEQNMNSIQTILANTKADGTNLEQVNKALDQLNEYSDKTIYNFGQMTKNIGTFTAAGVDLDTSIQSIKGISNLAAISGSSAEQASTAMYQLSQAVSTGTLKLMDWNSVVNAGMGGEVFQKALFETGKAMNTIKDVPIGQTFEEWTKSGNSFRESLQDGWITADVLTTTLQGFTGEMTDAELAAKGFTQDQIAAIQEMGRTGVEAATKVRTLTQLIDTTKEAIGSGWSESFRIVIGNFEEATALFSGISDAVGGFIKRNAEARNEVLQGWKELGGRTLLIDTLEKAFRNLADVLLPIKEAFQEIFPPMTAQRLFDLTKGFANLVDALKPSQQTMDNLKSVFKGLFSILSIGGTIIKEAVRFIVELVGAFTGLGSGNVLGGLAKIGDFFTMLREKLVVGGAIKDFFNNLEVGAYNVIQVIKSLIEVVVDFFKNIGDNKAMDAAGGAVDRLQQRFETLKDFFGKIKDLWGPFGDALSKVGAILDRVWDAISNWFGELGQKLAAVMGPGDFDATLDAINVGLLGGISLMIGKWLKGGINFDLGGGLLESIKKTFGELTGVLSAMQTEIKADALLKIAAAVGVLTASVVVLSMIDSAALTKAMTAMAIGFGQLLGAFAIINKMDTTLRGSFNFAATAVGITLLAGAILVLSVAAKNLAELSWEELARGLAGVAGLLTVISIAVIPLTANVSGMMRVGAALIMIGVALNLLAGAVKIFATMSWGEMGKGFAAVAGGLLIIAGAMNLMPSNMIFTGAGLLAVAISLNILAGAMKVFATMDWGEIAKGIVAIGGGLLVIAGAMNLMPANLPITAAGLVLVSFALVGISKVMKSLAEMSWGEIAKGIVAMAGALVVLAVGTNAMSGAIAGAIAMTIVSGALLLLAQVIKQLANLSWGELLQGLVGIAAVFVVLGAAAAILQPLIPALLGLGAALFLIGAGLALFGAGALLAAQAFEIFARSGEEGAKGIVASLMAVGEALPALMAGFARGLVEIANVLIEFAPVLAKALVVVLGHLLDGLILLIPKALVIIGQLLSGILKLIRDKFPEYVQTGISLILALLTGIRDNIGQVVETVVQIVIEFIEALTEMVPKYIDAIANFYIAVLTGAAEAVGRVSGTLLFGLAASFIQGFMDGLAQSTESGPLKWFKELAGNILSWIGDVLKTLWQKGVDLITGLFGGIVQKAIEVTAWFVALPVSVLEWIGNVVGTLVSKGTDFITGLLNGILNKIGEVTSFFTGLGSDILGWIGDVARTLWDKGWGLIQGLWDGIWENFVKVKDWFGNIDDNIKNAIGDLGNLLYDIGWDILESLLDGMKGMWENVKGWVSNVGGWIADLKGPPEKDKILLVNNGRLIMQGLQTGMEDEWDVVAKWLSEINPAVALDPNMGDNMANTLNGAISQMVTQLEDMGEFSPVITPVLDLTRVAADSKLISDYLPGTAPFTPTYSYAQASTIASTTIPTSDTETTASTAGGVKFEQNIYAPSQLSTADIYKQTRNQITMAKEELSIP